MGGNQTDSSCHKQNGQSLKSHAHNGFSFNYQHATPFVLQPRGSECGKRCMLLRFKLGPPTLPINVCSTPMHTWPTYLAPSSTVSKGGGLPEILLQRHSIFTLFAEREHTSIHYHVHKMEDALIEIYPRLWACLCVNL